MKLKFLSIILLILCTACVPGGDNLRNQSLNIARQMASITDEYFKKHGKDKTINEAKNSVKQRLKDPSSAEFTNVQLRDYVGGKVVCGYVNAKNSFGGYVGAKQFIASPFIGQIYQETGFGNLDAVANAGILDACD